ncbi:hypothetical protein [Kutzneria sp. CA-103260]|uniref:hypothetical protein n=1 Tax=Kutzneria sp. CA-103260 TaxID=2802641 RepID=UPI001BA602F1|nr:hypothetical protein [Kutzneria sp. CA-103260]QUQ63057.1 hypothetical protein JJ691_07690 [Kutzneria sp. CA-103260]
MNEQDLREALRDAMTDAVPPRPVTADAALTKAQQARRARRANLAGLGVGVAVIALVAGAFTINAPRTLVGMAAQATPTSTTPAPTSSTEHGDRTQANGPQNDKSVQLLTTLDGVLPSTVAPATDQQLRGAAFALRTHQAQVENWDTNTWSYEGIEPVASVNGGAGVGRVLVEVYAPGNDIPTDICKAAQAFWGVGGDCAVKQVGDKAVGLIAHTADKRIDSVAAYRYSDGTVVYLAQSKDYFSSNLPGLATPPLTGDQLASLVLTPGFKVG